MESGRNLYDAQDLTFAMILLDIQPNCVNFICRKEWKDIKFTRRKELCVCRHD